MTRQNEDTGSLNSRGLQRQIAQAEEHIGMDPVNEGASTDTGRLDDTRYFSFMYLPDRDGFGVILLNGIS